MANLTWLSSLLKEAGEVASKGVIPEQAERLKGAGINFAEKPPVSQRHADVPMAAGEQARSALRSIPGEMSTRSQRLLALKESLSGLFNSQPGVSTDLQAGSYRARWRSEAAEPVATMEVRERVLSKLQGSLDDRIAKTALLQDYLVNSDDLATLQRKYAANPDGAHVAPGGRTIDQVQEAQSALVRSISKSPDTLQAYHAYRSLVDEMFDTYVKNGYINPSRRLEDYTPFVKIQELIEANSAMGGETSRSRTVLDQLKKRQGSTALRHTGALRLVIDQLTDLNVKLAEDGLLMDVLKDKTLNRTAEFKPGDVLPAGWTRYSPEPGMPGYGIRDDAGNLISGFINSLGGDESIYRTGFVLPERVVRMFNEFNPPVRTTQQRIAFDMGSKLAKQLTVYNPGNTILNLESDVLTAMLGEPGRKWDPVGVLRMYPKAVRSAFRGIVKNEMDPDYVQAVKEGVTSGTYASTVDGAPIDVETAKLIGDEIKGGFVRAIPRSLRAARQVVEAAPRIAAGMAAREKGGDFGATARFATLEFGAGNPAHMRNPYFRALFPFWSFMGLASKRVFSLVTAKGSRGRALAALTIPPIATAMWNNQNEDYKRAERAVPEWGQNTMHVIFPDPDDPAKPLLDRNGKPVIMPIRFLVTEAVAQMFGLGNLPSRLLNVAEGRKTVGEFAGSIPSEFVKNVGQQAVLPNVALSLASGKDQLTGEEAPRAELLMKALPVGRMVVETAKGFENAGAAEAAKRAAETSMGVSFINPVRKGKGDALRLELKRELREARSRMKSANRKGDTAEAKKWRKRALEIIRKIERVKGSR